MYVRALVAGCSFPSVDLDRGVDLPHEEWRAHVSQGPTHQSQAEREQSHVAEVESRLEQAVHSRKSRFVFMDIRGSEIGKVDTYLVLKK